MTKTEQVLKLADRPDGVTAEEVPWVYPSLLSQLVSRGILAATSIDEPSGRLGPRTKVYVLVRR